MKTQWKLYIDRMSFNLVSRVTVYGNVKWSFNTLGRFDLVDTAGPGRHRMIMVVERGMLQRLRNVNVSVTFAESHPKP